MDSLSEGMRAFWADVSNQYGGFWNFQLGQDPINTGRIFMAEQIKVPNDLPENISPYFIDDIWLSFIAYKYYSWELQYSFLPEYKTFNVKNSDSKKQALCDTLYKEKQKFFDYLIKKGWNLKKNNTNKIYKNYKNNNINNNFNNILFKIKR